MNLFVGVLAFWTILVHVTASDEVINILNTAKDLTLQETNALRPLFIELQKQHDYITKALETEGENDIVPWQKEIWPESTKEDHIDLLENILVVPENIITTDYNANLPTLGELIGKSKIVNSNLTKEEITELEDMQEILQETLDEAQSNINEIVRRAMLIESEFLKLNKPKIVMYIYRALSVVFRYSARLRRAAYCVYAHVPQLNESLQNINVGVECYKYTSRLILHVQNQTVQSVNTIKRNVFDLAKVYKKIADKKSIIGKIITSVLNLLRIARDVRESYIVAMKALDDLENKLPDAVAESLNCGIDFASLLPQILSTVTSVTTCITYDERSQHESSLPDLDHDFDFGDIN